MIVSGAGAWNVVPDQEVRVMKSRTDSARTATRPMMPATFCHHRLRISFISAERLAMMMMSAASTGAMNTVSA